jgi:hypothetical protein
LIVASTPSSVAAAGAPASGKVEIKSVDPNHTITGVLANVGVYAVVAPTCTIGATELGVLATIKAP